MQDLKIRLVQADLVWEDIEANLDRLSEMLSGSDGETDLILLPEMFSTGFSMNPERFAARNEDLIRPFMLRLAKKHGALIGGSVIMEEGGEYFNRFLLMSPEGKSAIYDKRHCFTLAGEEKHYSPGKKKVVINWRGWRICPLVCYDLRFPVWSRNALNSEGQPSYDLLLYVANWPERRREAWRALLPARAIENMAFVAAVNRVGEDGNGVSHSGDSAVYDPIGEQLGEWSYEEGVFDTVISAARLGESRERFGFWRDGDQFSVSDAETEFVDLN